jgi:hypothetical protein
MLSIYLPLTESQLSEQSENRNFWIKRKTDAQKKLGENRLHKEHRNAEKEQRNKSDSSNSTFEVGYFALGAILVSAVFAIHFGLIPIQSKNIRKNVPKNYK